MKIRGERAIKEHVLPGAQLSETTRDPTTGRSDYRAKVNRGNKRRPGRDYLKDTTILVPESKANAKTHGKGGTRSDQKRIRDVKKMQDRARRGTGRGVELNRDIVRPAIRKSIEVGISPHHVARGVLGQLGNLFDLQRLGESGRRVSDFVKRERSALRRQPIRSGGGVGSARDRQPIRSGGGEGSARDRQPIRSGGGQGSGERASRRGDVGDIPKSGRRGGGRGGGVLRALGPVESGLGAVSDGIPLVAKYKPEWLPEGAQVPLTFYPRGKPWAEPTGDTVEKTNGKVIYRNRWGEQISRKDALRKTKMDNFAGDA